MHVVHDKLFVWKTIICIIAMLALGWLCATQIWAYWSIDGYFKVKANTFLFPSLSLSTEVHFKHHNRLRASLVEFNDALYSVLQSKYHHNSAQ